MLINIETHMHLEMHVSEKLGPLLGHRYDRCLIVIDSGFGETDKAKAIVDNLNKYYTTKVIKILSSNEPTYQNISDYSSLPEFIWFRDSGAQSSSVLIGIGGGSAMDVSKVLAALVTNPGNPLDYRGFDQLKAPGVDCYLVPTTAGTGSESSYNASLIDTNSNKKMGINGRYMYAKGSFLDPTIMLECPRNIALSSAVDAFVHCIEGFICKNANPISDGLATKGLELIWDGLKAFEGDWDNEENWKALMLGAHIGGIVQMNSGSGIAAAISYPLGVYHQIPHGIGGGIFAPGIMAFNQSQGITKYKKLDFISDGEFVDRTIERFEALGVPTKLSEYKLFAKDLDHLVQIMGTQQAAFDQNPVDFNVTSDFTDFINNYLE